MKGFLVAGALVAAVLAPEIAPGPASGESRAAAPGKTYSWSFDADTLGQAPMATRVASGRWMVVEDSSKAGARLLVQGESDDGLAFHWIQFLKPKLADQEVGVRFRIRSGEIDPSAGLAFQLDPKGKNGYLVRVSGRSRELVAHYILNGRRRDLKVARMEPPGPGEWHTLGVRRAGERIEVLYDGVVRMKFRDERFREGNVGLWTEDDTVADFTGLSVRAL